MSIRTIRRNDVVVVTAGANKGKSGKVLQVLPLKGRALVEGVNLVKKCLRRTQERPQGGISEKEAPIPLSNLMLQCPTCKRGVRTRRDRDGKKPIRKCKRCGHSFDA